MSKGNKKTAHKSYNGKVSNKKSSNHTGVKETPKVFVNFFYMTPEDANSRNIVDCIQEMNGLDIEIWEDVEVIEIGLSMKQTIDIIKQDADSFGDDNDQKFLADHGIKSVFSIEVEQQNVSVLKEVFSKVKEHYKGFVCSDSDDFMPIIVE